MSSAACPTTTGSSLEPHRPRTRMPLPTSAAGQASTCTGFRVAAWLRPASGSPPRPGLRCRETSRYGRGGFAESPDRESGTPDADDDRQLTELEEQLDDVKGDALIESVAELPAGAPSSWARPASWPSASQGRPTDDWRVSHDRSGMCCAPCGRLSAWFVRSIGAMVGLDYRTGR